MVTLHRGTLAGMVAALALWAAPARAQAHGGLQGGFVAAIGAGAGSADFACDVCLTDHQVSAALQLRAGMAVTPDLALTMDVSGWRKHYASSGGSATADLGFLTLDAQWYPAGGSQFFVTAGGGVAAFRDAISSGSPGATTLTATSVAATAGLGWDLRVGDRWGITPYVNFYGAARAPVQVNSAGSSRRLGATLVQAGIALHWRQHARHRVTAAEWLHPDSTGR